MNVYLQTNEAAAPMDTAAEMKQVREEQDDTPEKSSAVEDAPLVNGFSSHCLVPVWYRSLAKIKGE